MSSKKVLASEDASSDMAKFTDLQELLGDSDWVDPQELDARDIVVEDKEEVRRADIYMENGSTLTVNYGGSVYVTDGITNYQSSSGGGSSASPANSIQLSDGSGAFTAANWTISSNNILPGVDDSYDIGSPTNRVQDLYLGPQSIKIGKDSGSTDFLSISSGDAGGTAGNMTFKSVPEGSGTGIAHYVFENASDEANLSTQIQLRGGAKTDSYYFRLKTDGSQEESMTLRMPRTKGASGQSLVIESGGTGENLHLSWETPLLDAAGSVGTTQLADDSVTGNKLNNTAVTAGSYTNADITVDAQGRVTSASDGSSSGLNNVVEDTTPQLGGELDAQDNNIIGVNQFKFNNGPLIKATNNDKTILLNPSETVGDAANAVRIGPIGNAAAIRDNNYADGSNRNICQIEADSGKSLVLASNAFANTSYLQINGGITTDFSGTKREGIELRVFEQTGDIGSVAIKSRSLNANSAPTPTLSPDLRFYNKDGNYIAFKSPTATIGTSDYTFVWPTEIPSTSKVLQSDNSGNLSWVSQSSSGMAELADDTTPELSGNLNLNDNDIITGDGKITYGSGDNTSEIDLTYNGGGNHIAIASVQSIDLFLDSNGGSGTENLRVFNNLQPTTSYGGGTNIDANAIWRLQDNGDMHLTGDIKTLDNGDLNIDPNGTGVAVFEGNTDRGSGQFKLNCENNSHGITIKGPPHSAGADYTLTLPDDDGSANQVLETDGSGNLSWVNQASADTESIQDIVGGMVSGNTETNINVTYNDATGKLNFAATDTDTDTTYTSGSGITLSGTEFKITSHRQAIDVYRSSQSGIHAHRNMPSAGEIFNETEFIIYRSNASGPDQRVQLETDLGYSIGDVIYIKNEITSGDNKTLFVESVGDSNFVESPTASTFLANFKSFYDFATGSYQSISGITKFPMTNITNSTLASGHVVEIAEGKRMKFTCIEISGTDRIFEVTKA